MSCCSKGRTIGFVVFSAVMLVLTSPGWAGSMLSLNQVSNQIFLNNGAKYSAVGAVVDQEAIGSGTLIAPDWVLTAGHVVGTSTESTFYVNSDYYTGGEAVKADAWYTPSSWNYDLFGGNDIALIHLSRSVTDVTPMQMYTGNSDTHQVDTIVGYGVVGDGYPDTPRVFDGYKRAGVNYIDGRLFEGTPYEVSNIMTTRLDPEPWQANYAGPYPDPTYSNPEADFPQGREYLINHGDSGGPNLNGDNEITAVHSFGLGFYDGSADSSFSDMAGSTRVSPWVDWINTVIYDVKHGITPPATSKGSDGSAIFSSLLEVQQLVQEHLMSSPLFSPSDLATLKETYPNMADYFQLPTASSYSSLGYFLGAVPKGDLGTLGSLPASPEPGSLALLAAASVTLLTRRRRVRRG